MQQHPKEGSWRRATGIASLAVFFSKVWLSLSEWGLALGSCSAHELEDSERRGRRALGEAQADSEVRLVGNLNLGPQCPAPPAGRPPRSPLTGSAKYWPAACQARSCDPAWATQQEPGPDATAAPDRHSESRNDEPTARQLEPG
jgi:hypothetical protein